MYNRRGRGGYGSKATSANVQCQKCLQRGHYSYECTVSIQNRPYKARPSRTQILANPSLAPRLPADTLPPAENKPTLAELVRKTDVEKKEPENREANHEPSWKKSKRRGSISRHSHSRSPSPPLGTSRQKAPTFNDRKESPARSRQPRQGSYDAHGDRSVSPGRGHYQESPPPRYQERSYYSHSSRDPSPVPRDNRQPPPPSQRHRRDSFGDRGELFVPRRSTSPDQHSPGRRSTVREDYSPANERTRRSPRGDSYSPASHQAQRRGYDRDDSDEWDAPPARFRGETRGPKRGEQSRERARYRSRSPEHGRRQYRSRSIGRYSESRQRHDDNGQDSPMESNRRRFEPAPDSEHEPEAPRERSLSPFSKRVAMTRALNTER